LAALGGPVLIRCALALFVVWQLLDPLPAAAQT